MAFLEPLDRRDLAAFEPLFQAVESTMGFVPNSLLTMARRPEILQGFAALAGSVLQQGRLEPELKQLVALTASTAAGCRYCQAHTSHSASHAGAATEKIQAVWELDSSPLFDDRERAALRLARDAALSPSQATPAHFDDLQSRFEPEEVVEIVAVVALFGFLNRWNDTLATQLESAPRDFAEEVLAIPGGWQVGKHA